MDSAVFAHFIKCAMGTDFAKMRKELSMPKPDPISLNTKPINNRPKVKGLKMPRLATPRPKLQATKGTAPLSIRAKIRPMS